MLAPSTGKGARPSAGRADCARRGGKDAVAGAASRLWRALALLCALGGLCLLAGCAQKTKDKGIRDPRIMIQELLPPAAGTRSAERAGWAADIYEPFVTLGIPATRDNVCAVIAVIQQESSFRVNPVIPQLPRIAMGEIYERAQHIGIPRPAVELALLFPSSSGRSYKDLIDVARTEKDLSDIYEDMIGNLPLGKRLLDGYNPIRTRGPMQVNVQFADEFERIKPYPFLGQGNLHDELFTRRASLYFGVAHLLAYSAPYGGSYRYRFADFNAGQYASRNAAFQKAVEILSGRPLQLDGALVPHDGSLGNTERALRRLAGWVNITPAAIHSALALGKTRDLDETPLYRTVFALAERIRGRALPRALVPDIQLHSPKIKDFSTARYTRSVERHFEQCRNPSWFKGLMDFGRSRDSD